MGALEMTGLRAVNGKELRAHVWLIENSVNDGLPTFFSPKVARMVGSAHGWTHEVADAMHFETDVAAQRYVDKWLPTLQVNIVKRGVK